MSTRHSAYAGFDEGHLGMLRPGYHADFVVLSEDPLCVDPEAISEIKVLATYVGGRPTFEV
jgi:predicted amidohydrolase YtcJ